MGAESRLRRRRRPNPSYSPYSSYRVGIDQPQRFGDSSIFTGWGERRDPLFPRAGDDRVRDTGSMARPGAAESDYFIE